MKTTFQGTGISVLKHGEMVWERLSELIKFLKGDELKSEWRLPEWVIEYKQEILKQLLPTEFLWKYATYHDCGKPYCRILDSEGRQHFPDHAKKSQEIWLECSKEADFGGVSIFNDTVARLMGMDMDIHTIKAEELPEFSKRPEAISLLITGLCEIHANSTMFGGIESTSFKIKYKQIDKRGKQLCKMIFDKFAVAV